MSIKVVTDSTADLPDSVIEELGIVVVPLNIHFGTQTYKDGVDLGPDEFFRLLTSGIPLPTTSQPSVGEFVQVYKQMAEDCTGIVSIHISSKLSGTVNSATQAREQIQDTCPLEIVDGLSGSVGTGLVAISAARVAQQGGTLEEVTKAARDAVESLEVFMTVDTLEYLQKGGRLGKASALLGTLLSIKPILTCHEGEIHPLEKVRSRGKALERLFELSQDCQPFKMAAVAYTTTPEQAEEIASRLRPMCTGDVLVSRLGATISVHLGPGAIGIALLKS